MPIDNPLTAENLAKLPLDSSINPNITIADSFNESQRVYMLKYYNATDEELAAFDEQFTVERGVPFSREIENLIDGAKSKLRKPLENPILPKGIIEDPKWQEYISNGVSDPDFVPTDDPDEIANIIDMSDEWFDRDKYFAGGTAKEFKKALDDSDDPQSLLFPNMNADDKIPGLTRFAAKRGVEAMDFINWAGSNLSPNAFRLSKYEKQKELAEAGITYSEGASLYERFKSFALTRNRDARDIESVVADTGGTDFDSLGYRLPSAENLYPGRPKGQQGPVIRYQRNQDGTIESIFPWNEPGVTAGDWAEYVTREVPALAAEIAVTKKLRTGRVKEAIYFKKPFEKVRNWGKYAGATGLSAAAADWAKIASGQAVFGSQGDFGDSFKEALLIGAYTTGGNAAATAILNGATATWSFFTGKLPPEAVVKKIVDLRNTYQSEIKRLGFKEGTPEARALFDDLIGKTQPQVKQRMEEVTGLTYELFPGMGQSSPDGDFALSLLNLMEKEGFQADKTIELLQNQILTNKGSRQLFAQRILMQSGDPEVAKQSAASLGDKLGIEISQQLDGEIDEAWKVFSQATEEGILDEAILRELGFDDVQVLGINPASNALPGELGDEVAQSRYLFQKIDDAESQINAFKNPTIRRLALTQRRYMKKVTDKLDGLMENYGGLRVNLTPSSPLAKQVNQIMKTNTAGDIFKNDKALRSWLVENIDGPKTQAAIFRLQGRTPSGDAFGGNAITFENLHKTRTLLHELRNSLSGKMREPSAKAVNELISAVEKQQQNMFRSAASRLKNPGEGIDTYMNRTDFGKNYWETLSEFGTRSEVANNRFIQNLLKAGDESDASFMTALMSNKSGGSNFHPIADPLFAMLRDDKSPMGFQMIVRSQRAIAAQYKKDVIEPFMAQQGKKKDFKGMQLAHEKWMNKHGGLIKASFDEGATDGQILRADWDNMNSTVNFVEKMTVKRDKTLQIIADKFEPILGSANSPEEMILRIARGEGLENVSGALRLRTDLARILKQSGDPDLERNVKTVIRKDIWNQIMDTGANGEVSLNAKKLNDLLTGDFPVGGGSGQIDNVSFDKLYGMFLTKSQIDDLKILNSAAQSEVRRQSITPEAAKNALALGQKESLEIPTLGRLLFGPLNPYTYRLGWRERALDERVGKLLGEMVLDPKKLDKVMKQINRKMDINDAIRFFNSLDSTIAHDIGRDLRELQGESDDDTAFLSEADENPFASAEYFNYLQEYASSNKQLPTRGGFLPTVLRENLDRAPVLLGAGLTAGAAAVTNMGGDVVNYMQGGSTE
jgi:hypothetical protein